MAPADDTLSSVPDNVLASPPDDSFEGRASEPAPLFELSRLLRIVGSVLLIASASTFLLQQWDSGNDLARYALLLAHTAIFGVAAFVCGLRVKESRGARTFLGIVLAVLPIDFAVLGGLVYSRLALDAPTTVLPEYAVWVAPSGGAALLAALVTAVVVAPLCFVAHLALARGAARRLTALSLAANALLLVPVRDPNTVAILLGLGALALGRSELKNWSQMSTLSTLEGRIVRGLLFVPLALLIGRTVYLYDPTPLLTGVFLLSVACVLFAGAPRVAKHASLVDLAQASGALLAAAGWYFVTIGLDPYLIDSVTIPLWSLPYAVTLVLMSKKARQGGLTYRRGAALIAAGAVAANALLYGTTDANLLCLLTGVAVAAYGTVARHRTELAAGIVTAAVGLVRHLDRAIHVEDLLNWGTLSLAGIVVIFLAAYVERHQDRIASFIASFDRQTRRS